MPSAAPAMSGEWAATETGSSIARLAPRVLRDGEGGLHGRALARDHDLPRRVAVRDAEDAVLGRLGDELREPGVVEADDRGHAAFTTGTGRLHQLAAGAHESHGVGEVQRAGGDERRVLPHRVAGGEGRVRDVHREGIPALAHGLEIGDRGGDQRRLGVLGPVQLLLGTLPGEARDGLAQRLVRGSEDGGGGRGGLGEGAAHADELAALAGEDESDLVHRGGA